MADESDPQERLLLLGASVRAAAFSAARAGFAPLAGDLFADVDLRACCPAWRVERYPHGLADVAAEHAGVAWMYTGGLENYPKLVGRIAKRCPLLGNGGETLRRVRDPQQLRRALAEAALPFPRRLSLRESSVLSWSERRRWLLKRLRSCGGLGVEAWDGSTESLNQPGVFLQERIDGQPCSAAFVAAGGKAVFLGATEQLIGASWCGARGFQYAGSLGPLPLEEPVRRQFEQIGDRLAEAFNLVGLFGVDAILSSGVVWPLEVNPRYTASLEILERASEMQTVRMHVDACRHGRLPDEVPTPTATTWHGKAILFAREGFDVSHDLAERLSSRPSTPWPMVADLPATGTRILPGHPVMTVFAEAATHAELLNELQAAAAALPWEKQHANS